MLGLSGYFAYLTNQLPASAGIGHRRFNIVMCIGFAAAGYLILMAVLTIQTGGGIHGY